MIGDKQPGSRRMRIGLCCGFLILGLAACNFPGAGSLGPEAEATEAQGGAQDVELGQQEQALKKGECPDYVSLRALMYRHEFALDLGDEDTGRIHFEQEEQQPAYFYFRIIPSGQVISEGLPNSVTINVSGWHTTPSKECPINYIKGTWPLAADITGSCKKDVLTLKIEEHFESTELTGSCGDPISVPGGSSGPELTLTFDLSDFRPTDGIISGSRGDPMYAWYWYQLTLRIPKSPTDFP